MNRILAVFLAILVATVTISSACASGPGDDVQFTLERGHQAGDRIHARFRDPGRGNDHEGWSSDFAPADLAGLDLPSFRASGTRPLHFSIVREAGRLDCSGSGGNEFARGSCRFAENPPFVQLLVSRGIGRPDRNQAFGLMALNVRREIIEAVAAAHYPTPTISELMAMTAVGVNGQYISAMARAGYRPRTIHTLVEFRALGITPEWIGGFARAGYGNLPADELVQLRALNVTPDFIAGYERIGYRNLPASTLVQLKALDITPEFVRAHVAPGSTLPPVSDLMQMKMFGRRR